MSRRRPIRRLRRRVGDRRSRPVADGVGADGLSLPGIVPSALADPPVVGVALATGAYLSVFFSITAVVGGSARVAAAVLAALVAGVAVARVLDVRAALSITAGLIAVGLAAYYTAIPQSQRALFTPSNAVFDTISLLTGLSVLRLVLADVWVLSIAPVPTFLTWYLVARGRHLQAAMAAGAALGFFVLTGDAGTSATLLGVVGIALAAGLTTLSIPGGLAAQWDTLAVVLAAMVLLSTMLTVVPGGTAQPWQSDRGSQGIESALVGEQESLQVIGPARLSPEVRFTVRSTREAYWHTGSYDRYTGDGWVSTGTSEPYTGPVEGPPGETVDVDQTVTAHTDLDALPAAWKPVAVDEDAADAARVDSSMRVQPGATLEENESVSVQSAVVDPDPAELRAAETSYPDGVVDRYTQLPEDTPERVGDRASTVVEDADADNPYDAAVAIERHLEESKSYSLHVARPDGDIADEFLFEMEAGYCVYFATTMVTMLRAEGIPAKLAVGYGSGERVSEDEWVVRGQDAHAWVMVYFPDHGWVEFDPTPSDEREDAREDRLTEARQNDEAGVDTEQTAEDEETSAANDSTGGDDVAADEEEDERSTETDDSLDVDRAGREDADAYGQYEDLGHPYEEYEGAVAAAEASDEDGAGGWSLPDRETFGYGLLVLFGVIAGAHRVGATTRAYRALWLRLTFPRGDQRTDAERAFARLEILLGYRYRPRRRGETYRDYLDALAARDLDERVYRVVDVYERSVYGGGVDAETAAEAVRTVRRIALEATPVVGRFLSSSES